MTVAASRGVLLTASAACALIVLDTNIVAVTLPRIAHDLQATFVDIEWVVSAYMLTFAAGLLPAGGLADRFGRKRMLLIGLAIFTLASLGCGLAGTVLQLNVARAVKGVGAALLLTAALATIAHVFHEERARARAWAFWGACMGSAMLVAPSLGGVISQWVGWRWVFLLNLPVCVLLAVMVVRHVGESRDDRAARLDGWGSLFLSGSLFLLVWALIDANRIGWLHGQTLARGLGGVLLLAAFVGVERLQQRPMVDLALFRNPRFLGALLAMAAYAGCAQVMMTFMPFHLQVGLGFSAVDTGLAMVPFGLAMLVFPRIGVVLSRRLDGSVMLASGLLLVGVGNALAAWAATTVQYLPFALATTVLGAGAGLLNGDTQKNIMACVPRERSGMASGLSTTTRFSAIVLAFGVLGGLLAYRTQALLAEAAAQVPALAGVSDSIVSRLVAGDMRGALAVLPMDAAVLQPVLRTAFAGGFAWVMLAAAAAALVGSAVVYGLMRPRPVPSCTMQRPTC